MRTMRTINIKAFCCGYWCILTFLVKCWHREVSCNADTRPKFTSVERVIAHLVFLAVRFIIASISSIVSKTLHNISAPGHRHACSDFQKCLKEIVTGQHSHHNHSYHFLYVKIFSIYVAGGGLKQCTHHNFNNNNNFAPSSQSAWQKQHIKTTEDKSQTSTMKPSHTTQRTQQQIQIRRSRFKM